MKISILGAGSWGTALGFVLCNNGHEVKFWLRDEEKAQEMNETKMNEKYLPGIKIGDDVQFTSDIYEAVEFANVLLLAVPSQKVRSVLEQIKDSVSKDTLFVNVSKGVEIGSLKRISEVVGEFFPENEFVVLSGPSHAEEVGKNIPTTLVSSSTNLLMAEMVQDLFTNENLRIYTNLDVVGVELGGALKNIIALGAGISDGIGYGDNSKAALMTRGIKEIALLGNEMGAKFETFSGLTGIGDLIVTCTSMHSRNRRCGILIGEGKNVEDAVAEIGMVVEGIYTIKSAYFLGKKYGVEMPITNELYKVIYEGQDAKASVRNLMVRKKKHEMEDTNWL